MPVRFGAALLAIPIRSATPFGFIMLTLAPLLVLVVFSLATALGILVVLESLRLGLLSGITIPVLRGLIVLDIGVHARGPSLPMPQSLLTGC
jgi:hypothetical protein